MGDGGAFGRKVKGVRVFAEDAADYVEVLVRRYRQERDGRAVASRSSSSAWTTPRSPRSRDARREPDELREPRAVPFYCPFCGEQELRPADPSGWRCESCERVFELSLLRDRGRC